MRKTSKTSLVLMLGWTLLLTGVLAFAPHAPAAEPSTGNLVAN